MKFKFSFLSFLSLALATVLSLGACSDSKDPNPNPGPDPTDYDFAPVISTYVDNVVMPTYADMKNKAKVLLDKIAAFNDDPSNANLAAAGAAWLEVREPWEMSEAFLFGPCGDNGLNVDPMIDTWPFDMDQFTNKINGEVALTPAAVSAFDESTRGYHTIEYLIFKEGHSKDITTDPLSAREKEYLESAATVLYYDCVRLWIAWNGLDGISAADQAAVNGMKAIDYWDEVQDYLDRNSGSFSVVFKEAKSPYMDISDIVEEMVRGISDIAVEVAENKIALPASENDVTLVESHYAYNSLVDFVDNIKSIENAYYGTRTGSASANCLSTFVKSQNPDLDDTIVAAIANAKAKINSITYPFALNLNDTANIQAATAACMDIDEAILEILKLL